MLVTQSLVRATVSQRLAASQWEIFSDLLQGFIWN